jgi:hypothetical protein
LKSTTSWSAGAARIPRFALPANPAFVSARITSALPASSSRRRSGWGAGLASSTTTIRTRFGSQVRWSDLTASTAGSGGP